MEIDYNKPDYGVSVTQLIGILQNIVDKNPKIDFSRIGVGLNSGEYTCVNAELEEWDYKGKTRFGVDIY